MRGWQWLLKDMKLNAYRQEQVTFLSPLYTKL